tara:strand:+ start:166 stop:432 length:267 start_codon:yes stop_codon:yes gene_type:complete
MTIKSKLGKIAKSGSALFTGASVLVTAGMIFIPEYVNGSRDPEHQYIPDSRTCQSPFSEQDEERILRERGGLKCLMGERYVGNIKVST